MCEEVCRLGSGLCGGFGFEVCKKIKNKKTAKKNKIIFQARLLRREGN